MNKLIIISQEQFGYHTPTYYYCKYLRKYFVIKYICWDDGRTKIKMEDVNVFYVKKDGTYVRRGFRFLEQALAKIDVHDGIIFVKYFKYLSFFLRVLRPTHIFVLDIRTGSVNKNKFFRDIENNILKFETLFYKHVIIISKKLAKRIGIRKKTHIVPAGSEVISFNEKSYDALNLLYVGTLFNRNIHLTIHGFKQFIDDFGPNIHITYTIIGDGPNCEEKMLNHLIEQHGLRDYIYVKGRIPHGQLKPFFETNNIGISFVPITTYYDCQPVTKTFEYLLSGMPVIATKTLENTLLVNSGNGVLISDNAMGFEYGLKTIFKKKHLFNSNLIRNQFLSHRWENIVENNLNKYLDSIFR